MMLSLYKLATKDNHNYETEGVFYFYKTCEESELQSFLDEGWITNFGELKGKANEEKKQGQEASQEVLENSKAEPAKRGRKPKAQ